MRGIILILVILQYPTSVVAQALNVIENNKSWRDMTHEEYLKWYDDVSRCILEHSTTVQRDPRRVKKEKCDSSEFLSNETGRLYAGYGYSGKICIPPLSSRSHFKKVIKDYSDPNSKFLLTALMKIHQSNRTLILLGDSVTGQTYDALFGEIARYQDKYIQKITRSKNSFLDSLTTRIISSKGSVDSINIKYNHNQQESLHIYYIRVNYIEKIENASFYEGTSQSIWRNNKNLVHEIIRQYDGVIMLVNVALWYNNRQTFQNEIKSFLNDIYNLSQMKYKKNIIMWRETTDSHFDKIPSGYYRYRDHHQHQCVPHAHVRYNSKNIKDDDMIDWRNIDVENILKSFPYSSNFYYLQFHHITKPLFDMHLILKRPDSRRYGYPSQVDCNHFCWTPTLWQPIWYALAKVVGISVSDS